jgi:hypothetical protein
LAYLGLTILLSIIAVVLLLWGMYNVITAISNRRSFLRRRHKNLQFGYGILFCCGGTKSADGDEKLDEDNTDYVEMNEGGHQTYNPFTVDLGFEKLGLRLRKNAERVLEGVTGQIQHGQLTAVMGMSGKTVFY